MPVAIDHLPAALQFTLWGAECQQVDVWEDSLDSLVFHEQLATGSFRGRWSVEGPILKMMQMVHAEGKIAPYFGAGSRGACVYSFRPAPPACLVRVEHTVVGEQLDQQAAITRWPAANEPKPYYRFKIAGAEHANLRQWEHWVEDQAGSGRYTFQFGSVGLGPLGYTVEVVDHQTGTDINATDYASW